MIKLNKMSIPIPQIVSTICTRSFFIEKKKADRRGFPADFETVTSTEDS